MTKENETKLYNYLKAKAEGKIHSEKILCYDKTDKKRVDIPFCYEAVYDDVTITGDEGEIYELDGLELIQALNCV
jgi:hypothetical protein